MILWLTGKTGLAPATRSMVVSKILPEVGCFDVVFNSMHHKVPHLGDYAKKQVPPETYRRAVVIALQQDVKILRPSVIVINDESTLRAFVGKPFTLAQVRGSVYEFDGIPMLVLDNVRKMWEFIKKDDGGKRNNWAPVVCQWVFAHDFRKLARLDKGRRKNEPVFNFSLCKTLADVRYHCQRAKKANMIAEDTETKARHITVAGFTYDCGGELYSFAVPFHDPYGHSGCYWATPDEELLVRYELASLQSSPVYKTMQNGMYDCAYYIKEGMPPANWFFDSKYMMHAIWCEAPRALHNIASYFLDTYQYWKDDGKGDKEDGFGRTRDDMLRYWRYCAMDCHNTYLVTAELLRVMVQLPWAMANYNMHFSLAAGPCLAASLRGMKISTARHTKIMADKSREAAAREADLREFTGEADFNPRSSIDGPWFLYDIMGARPTRLQTKRKNATYGMRSTNEKVLKLIKEQGGVLTNYYIDLVLAAKQPAAVLSKYGDLQDMAIKGRFLNWLDPCATTTGRFNSGTCQFWTGTNAQNIPPGLREMFVADDGYVFLECDYGASDDRFIAYFAQDPDKIETVEDRSRDIHCKHAAIFFSRSYDDVFRDYKANEPWVVDSTVGIRQNTKRITHGRNYGEEAETMYNVMGRDAVVATAIKLGHEKAAVFTDRQLIGICAQMIDKYDHPVRGMYKRLRPWKDEIVKEAVGRGNLATVYHFTRKFFGNLLSDHKEQRELASLYGQGGTAGNINRALREIWYGGLDDGLECIFMHQGHDSLTFQLRAECLHEYAPRIIEIMERPCVIHGRSMRVPVDAKVGLTWGKDMLQYRADLSMAEIVNFEANGAGRFKGFAAKYPPDYDDIDALHAFALIDDVRDAGDDEDDDEHEELLAAEEPDDEENGDAAPGTAAAE